MSGQKNDHNKPIAGTVLQDFGNALTAVSIVGTFGAKKYSKSNWLKVENGIERYTDAMARHFLVEEYEVFDPDSNIIHAAHTAWNALARLELMLRAGGNIIDMGDTYVNISTNVTSEEFENAAKALHDNGGTGTGNSGQVSKAMHDSLEQRVRNSKEDFDEDTLGTAS